MQASSTTVLAPARTRHVVNPSYLSPFKAAHHLGAVSALRQGLLVAPRNIQVDLEAFCPHSCEFCSYRNVGWQDYAPAPMQFTEPARISAASSFPWSIAADLPYQMRQAGIPAIEITGGGESLVYPHIVPFLEQCNIHGIEIGLVTNGVAFNGRIREVLDPAKFKWVRFSCDATTPDVYSMVHRTPESAFGTLQNNIRNLVDWRNEFASDVLIGISFVITEHNFHQIAEAARFYHTLGADSIRYTFTFTPEGDGALTEHQRNSAKAQMLVAKAFEAPNFKIFTVDRLEAYNDPNTDFIQCGYQHFVWAIGYNGTVYPCCIMKYHAGYEIGDLSRQTLSDIVHSDARREFARNLIVGNCKPCYLRDKNKFIEYLLNAQPEHVNFV